MIAGDDKAGEFHLKEVSGEVRSPGGGGGEEGGCRAGQGGLNLSQPPESSLLAAESIGREGRPPASLDCQPGLLKHLQLLLPLLQQQEPPTRFREVDFSCITPEIRGWKSTSSPARAKVGMKYLTGGWSHLPGFD